ncbi:hypothetical protein PybrP1_002516 [[Pythium] brassicae (nom. inval.)]|nr:hypothetical protein PybrP1_002516 [[Pythium] brassicae (nom. inval.)]
MSSDTSSIVAQWEQLDHHFADVAPGIQLHYVDAGPRDATPVVLVHGWPDLAFAWRYHIAELSKTYRVIAPDLRGFGRSSVPQETAAYGSKNITSDLAKLLDILNLPRAVFVGHDWGGSIIYRMALYHPERVLAIAAFLTPYYPPGDKYIDLDTLAVVSPSLGYMKFLADTEASSKHLENAPSQVFTVMFRPPQPPAPAGTPAVAFIDVLRGIGHSSHPMYTQRSELLSEEELAFYVAEYAKSGFKGAVNYYATRAIDFETERELPRVIPHPALYVGGGRDAVLKPEMAAHMPQVVPRLETVIVEEGGHWLLWSHKAETTDVLLTSGARPRGQQPAPSPEREDPGMVKSEHMVSLRNPFPRAKKTADINDATTPSSASKPAGKLLSRPSNRIVSHSTSEAAGSSSGGSRSMASSALASLTRFQPLGMGSSSNQSLSASSASSTSAASLSSASTSHSFGNGDSLSRSSGLRDRDDDPSSNSKVGAASNGASVGSSTLPSLSASTSQAASTSNITVSAPLSSSGPASYQQRHQLASQNRDAGVLPGPSVSTPSAVAEALNKSNPRGLVGLQNLGNTCFMNSCLQCVSNIPSVAQYFASNVHAKEVNEASPTKGALAFAFGDLMKALWGSDKFSSVRPSELKRVIGKVASRFTGYEQQDAQEFLRFLLDGLHEDLNRIKKKPAYYEIKDRERAKDRDVSDEHWRFYSERNLSALSELFCGQLRSEIRCSTCGHRSLCFDVFWDLSLPVPKKPKSLQPMRIASVFASKQHAAPRAGDDERAAAAGGGGASTSPNGCSVRDCLKAYTDQELLAEGDAYYCAKCKTHRAVAKKISLYRLPQVLVLHLKRFSYSTFSRDKVSTAIQFPLLGLDLAEYCAADAVVDGSTEYDLTGVVHHVGSLNGGHYTAECLNKDTQEWFDFDDASVAAVKKPQLCSSSAYILFFRRREERSLTI